MEHDPLILRAQSGLHKRRFDARRLLENHKGSGFRVDDLLQFLFPVVQFLLALFLCSNAASLLSVTILSLFLTLDLIFLLLVAQKWVREMAVLSVGALLLGGLLGLHVYSEYTVFYDGYEDLRSFTNVIATQSPKQFLDAGMLGFAFSSTVDVSRAVGFRSFEEHGKMYCVAPITDASMSITEPVHFWAVGVDCCDSRSFFDCGDVRNAKAHTGVVVLRPAMFVPSGLQSWIGDRQTKLLQEYTRAVQLAQNVFGIAPPLDEVVTGNATATASSLTTASAFSSTTIPSAAAPASTTSTSSTYENYVFVEWSLAPFHKQQSFKVGGDAWRWTAAVFGALGLFFLAYHGNGGQSSGEDGGDAGV